MSLEELRQALPEAQRKHLDPNGPKPARMMASKGMLPLPPREMVIVLCGLTLDEDEKIRDGAKQSLGKLPEKILGPATDADLPPVVFSILLPLLVGQDALLEKIVLNRRTPDEAIAAVAPLVSEGVAEIIAANQERCMRSRALVDAIRKNPHILKSSLDRLFDFLVRAGVLYDDMPEIAEAMARLNPAEIEQAVANVELPPEAQALLEESAESESRAEALQGAMDGETPEASARVPLLKLLTTLSVSQKISLALKGNKEARTALIRDSNRVVATAAVRSPRLTEQEIVAAAQSRQVNDEVIRIIAGSKEMTRSYGVKVALVNNPKTPVTTSMRFLTLLRMPDLKAVARSKNIPSALCNQAKRLLMNKSGS